MTGCEYRKCALFVDGKCTDADPLYDNTYGQGICRYNEWWSSEEGKAELERRRQISEAGGTPQ